MNNYPTHCPNLSCVCHTTPYTNFYIKKGFFRTAHDRQKVPRYQCKNCGQLFSASSFKDTKGQHKPELNDTIFELYSSNVTLKRIASLLRCNKKTVIRKFMFMAAKVHLIHEDRIDAGDLKTSYVQFDEMETFEKTRMIPLSIAIAVRPRTGEIIDAEVATMNAKGHLAEESVEKYGLRVDTRKSSLEKILTTVSKCQIFSNKTGLFTIASDSKPAYIPIVKQILPNAIHAKYNRLNSNDLFNLNHVCGRIRHDMSRMNRQSWVTTKKKERLQGHLDMYIGYKNGYFDLIRPKREYSINELKRVCRIRYKYVDIDYAKRFRMFADTLPYWLYKLVKINKIKSFIRFDLLLMSL